MNIFVGNLSREATENDVKQKFDPFGNVLSVRIVRDMFSRESKGFGFVEMPGRAQAETAIRQLNATELLGKPMTVNEARPRPDGPRRGGRQR
jgi:RNA recognition motif-containing protein